MAVVTAAIIGASVAVAGSAVGAISAHQSKQRAKGQMMTAQRELEELELNRQDVINPYEDVENLSDLISDVSGMASNPFANLAVSTAAAEMQIEEADIALANTLDTMRATGAGAGGATALAQAALRSKKGVSAGIEQQEKANEDKRAAGEQALQQQKMAEAQRLQQADVAGEQFMFSTREGREMQQLDRTAAMLGASKQAEGQAQSDRTAAITGAVGGIGQIAGGYMASKS